MTIVFEPMRGPLDEDRSASHVGGGEPVALQWRRAAVETVDDHARRSHLEVAGLLVGRAEVRGGSIIVVVEHAVPAIAGVETSSVHVGFTQAAWDSLSPAIDALGPGLVVVGWYHSHPGLGAFFSGTDRTTQSRYFTKTWQIGLVVDPTRGERRIYLGPQCKEVNPPEFEFAEESTHDPADLAGSRVQPTHEVPGRPSLSKVSIHPTSAILALAALLLVGLLIRGIVRRVLRGSTMMAR